jgi:hypothetical protein
LSSLRILGAWRPKRGVSGHWQLQVVTNPDLSKRVMSLLSKPFDQAPLGLGSDRMSSIPKNVFKKKSIDINTVDIQRN